MQIVRAETTADGYRFVLTAIGDECVELNVVAPDGAEYPQGERCMGIDHSIEPSPRCLQHAESSGGGENASTALRCEVDGPVVVYGRAVNPVAYVCAVDFFGAGFGYPRFVSIGDDGLILASVEDPLDAFGPGHHFDVAGMRVGTEPLDAPSGVIYEMCESMAPWANGDTGPTNELQISAEVTLEWSDGISGQKVRVDFGRDRWLTFVDGEVFESSLSFIPVGGLAELVIGPASIEHRLDPPPDLNRQWALMIELGAGAVAGIGSTIEIDPALVTWTWVEY